MKYRSLPPFLCPFLFLLCSIPAAQAQRTGVAFDIPGSMFGTYDLEMEGATASSIYPDGTAFTLTLALDGSLCSSGLKLANPYIKNGIEDKFYWSSSAVGLEFSLDTSSGAFAGFGLATAEVNGLQTIYGTLDGEESETTDSCDINSTFFELAEANYPELFPESLFVLQQTTTLNFFRYYSVTDSYLIIMNGAAFASGGAYGNTPVLLGSVATLVAGGVDELLVPTSQIPLTFDDYYVSTYDLSFTNATTFSPIQNGADLTAVITLDDKLCIGETVLESPLYSSDSGRVIWSNPDAGHYYVLELLADDEKAANIENGVLDVYANGGQYLGSFEGERTQLSAECGDAQGESPDLTKINLMFQLAEQRLPELFPGGPQTYNQKSNGYIFRHYSETGITVQVKEQQVELKGGSFGTVYVAVGTLDQIIANLQARVLPVVLPAELTGTYAVTFSPSGGFSPIPGGESYDLALTEDGDICFAGVVLSTPYQDLNDPDLVYWEDPNAGFVLQMDLAATDGTGVDFTMLSDQGLELGTLSGERSQLLATCAGLLGGDVDVAAANELFALAEQIYSEYFPPSALTFNQFNGSSLLRYYPSTGVMITMTGADVYVSGGVFGTAQRSLGRTATLIQALEEKLPEVPPFALSVTGTVAMELGNLSPINRKIELSEVNVTRPVDTTTATLSALVKQVLGNELKGASTFVFTGIVSTTDLLQFDVRVNNQTTIATTNVARTYILRFVYSR